MNPPSKNENVSGIDPYWAFQPKSEYGIDPYWAFQTQSVSTVMNGSKTDTDNQTVISDITETNETSTVSSTELLQKVEDIRLKTETELTKWTLDELRTKCKELGIGIVSSMKKPALVQLLLAEFMKLWQPTLKDKKLAELKSICKSFDIKGITGLKRDDLCLLILNYCYAKLRFRLDDTSSSTTSSSVVVDDCNMSISTSTSSSTNAKSKKTETKKLSTIEELEKQKLEIETKMKDELDRQKKIAEDEMKQKIEEEKRVAEEEKRKEKEESKKKKQAIPKHVRSIVWNHYIGEDIIKHKCLCCKKVTVSNTNFEVGHVVSEKNGGTHEINNLRPICGACNHSMGTENMVDYVVKYGLFIG